MTAFEADIGHGLAQLVSNPSLNQCMHPHELHALEQLLMHHPLSTDDASRPLIRSGIAILSGLLSRECMTLDILKLFRPLTLDLVGRWKGSMDFRLCPRHDQIDSLHCGSPKHDLNGNIKSLQSLHLNAIQLDLKQEMMASALALILPIAPQITGFAVEILSACPNLFSFITNQEINMTRTQKSLKTAYRLLRFSKSTFSDFWDWSFLHSLLGANDDTTRVLAAEILVLVTGMSEQQRLAFMNQRQILRKSSGDAPYLPILEYVFGSTYSHSRLMEQYEIEYERTAMYRKPSEDEKGNFPSIYAKKEHLSEYTADLCGILLPSYKNVATTPSPQNHIVLTPNASRHLHAMALAISLKMPILLQGPPGCGKTSLVEEAAALTNRHDLLKIHLGDQTDSKMLLGTYICTSTPGLFKWQPGILTMAVSQGRWLLIEDIDRAPIEVISVLLPLLESRHLFLPSRGESVFAKDGFRIFATQTLHSSGQVGSQQLGDNLWTKVQMEEYPAPEIQLILERRFPTITPWIPAIFKSYLGLLAFFQGERNTFRCPTLRDLMKWCERIVSHTGMLPDNQSHFIENIFLEGLDCFGASVPNREFRRKVAQTLGHSLTIPEHRIEFFTEHYVPEILPLQGRLQVGRSGINCVANRKSEVTRTFAATGQSSRLLEKIVACASLNEPVLLVGETGTGKTSVIQYLASSVGQKLVVFNMSQQSDSSDLLGGFKPVDIRVLANPLREEFHQLFEATFSVKSNKGFLDSVQKTYIKKKWSHFSTGLRNAIEMAKNVFKRINDSASVSESAPTKKARRQYDNALQSRWTVFEEQVLQFDAQREQIKENLLFSFVEGALVRAIKDGHWVLLDEINLASAETLECLNGLLQDADSSILLMEKGDSQPVKRHSDFRIFGCMNPANDAGKRDLSPSLRNRFTEFWIEAPDSNPKDLFTIVRQYLKDFLPPGVQGNEICQEVTDFHIQARDDAHQGLIYDGADQRVHFSMRTLSRSLTHAIHITSAYGFRRALYEGICMTYATGLNEESSLKMSHLIRTKILNGIRNPDSFIRQIPKDPSDEHQQISFVLTGSFWLERGPMDIDLDQKDFVLTESVSKNLNHLSRAVVSRKYPVLIQGPTSVGKTSIIEYLAKRTGHRFVRINNHEHTDIQEYLGSYISNESGALVFQEGILVEALRKGYWIVLDELNLAPSDVLEALNRLLDDNRELFLPETQETIKPHPSFMLFATQNPVGQYGGRKQLSRAFRNRFLELHFSDIPENELETILGQRCHIPPSYAKKLVCVYKALQKSRGKSRIFDGSSGFVTLRDLFRWALRRADGYQSLAEDGYMILAERMRTPEECEIVKEVIEKELKARINPKDMYESMFSETMGNLQANLENLSDQARTLLGSIVWTYAMKRLFVLVSRCIQFSEPLLLVGETGCGKTTVCQLLAELSHHSLHIVNAHQHSETSDFLGSQRPARNQKQKETLLLQELRETSCQLSVPCSDSDSIEVLLERQLAFIEESKDLDVTMYNARKKAHKGFWDRYRKVKVLFEWTDGPLVQAMRQGDFFLLDEISLADDSVLERLNSVLEPARLLVLAEKGDKSIDEIRAAEGFRFFATMNPGGDYGKKELSPALRNRFTEIWVSSISDQADLSLIIEKKLDSFELLNMHEWHRKILGFYDWFAHKLRKPISSITSLRDILAWIEFMKDTSDSIGQFRSFFHGAIMTIVDGIGMNPLFGVCSDADELKSSCVLHLQAMTEGDCDLVWDELKIRGNSLGIEPFFIPLGTLKPDQVPFSTNAPTTHENMVRILRALQLYKPILLEGSPGVGKTSLVVSLAAMSGHDVVRINLSEQTDLMDLLGSDLPVEGGSGGEFAWRDGPFLQALKQGKWVLLDELNLASQQVLEGLNACLDHRSTIYIPELDRSFTKHPSFRVFGAQNPQHQGGGRKGLPKSFVNRFTLVYIEPLKYSDLTFICQQLYGQDIPHTILESMIQFNEDIRIETSEKLLFGWQGSPWEFNLRDVMRWADLVKMHDNVDLHVPPLYLDMIYTHRFRTAHDRQRVLDLFSKHFGALPSDLQRPPCLTLMPDIVTIGRVSLTRSSDSGSRLIEYPDLQPLPSTLRLLESFAKSIQMSWMPILTGPSSSGKTSMARLLASLCGVKLSEFNMNASVDAVELLGGFEQEDLIRMGQQLASLLSDLAEIVLRHEILKVAPESGTLFKLNTLIKSSRNNEGTEPETFAASFAFLQGLLTVNTIRGLEARLTSASHLLQEYANLYVQGGQGRFKWIDGSLIEAMQNGDWILIDNVNLCSTSVIDRLNSLLERNGVLMVNERGLLNGEIKIIKPHPNFRIIMTMDPTFGEISRAMRNRAVELYLDGFDDVAIAVDMDKMLNSLHISNMDPASFLEQGRNKDLYIKGKLFVEQLERGISRSSIITDLLFMSSLDSNPIVSKELTRLSDSTQKDISKASHLLLSLTGMNEKRDFFEPCSLLTISAAKIDSVFDQALIAYASCSLSADGHLRNLWLQYLCHFLTQKECLSFSEKIRLTSCARALSAADVPANSQKFAVILRTLYLMELIKHLGTSETPKKIMNMSLLEQSCAHLAGKLLFSDLRHPSLKYVAPLLQGSLMLLHSTRFIEKLLETEYDFLTSFESLFWILNDIQFNPGLLIVTLQKFKKDFLVLVNAIGPLEITKVVIQQLSKLLNDLFDCLDIDRIYSSIKIWRSVRPQMLKNAELVNIGMRIADLDKKLDFARSQVSEWTSHPIFSASRLNIADIRKTLAETRATIYFLDESNFSAFENLENVFSLVDKMEILLPNISVQAPAEVLTSVSSPSIARLQELTVVTRRLGDWSINDGFHLLQESALLLQLVRANDSSQIAKLLPQVRLHLEYGLLNTSRSALDLDYWKRLSWLIESQEQSHIQIQNILGCLLCRWNRFLWNNAFGVSSYLWIDYKDGLLNGNVLDLANNQMKDMYLTREFQGPTLLETAFVTVYIAHLVYMMPRAPLYALPTKREQLLRTGQTLSGQEVPNLSLNDVDSVMFLSSFEKFVSAFRKDLSNQTWDTISSSIQVAIKRSSNERLQAVESVAKELSGNVFHSDFLKMLSEEYLLPSILSFAYALKHNDYQGIARAFVSLAQAYLEAYVPEHPLDPAFYSQSKLSVLEKLEDHLAAKVVVGSEMELWKNGTIKCDQDLNTKSAMSHLKTKMIKHSKQIAFRPTKSQLDDVIADLKSMKKIVLGKQSFVSQFLDSLKDPMDDSQLKSKEQYIQNSISNCIERFEDKYPLYADLIQPINQALYKLKYGLRMMYTRNEQSGENTLDMTACLFKFIGNVEILDLSTILDHQALSILSQDLYSRKRLQICCLEHIRAHAVSYGYLDGTVLGLANRLFSDLSNIWIAINDERASKQRESEEFYKYKQTTHLIETNDEADAKEFESFFPDFMALYDSTTEIEDKPKLPTEMDDSDVLRIMNLHRDIVNGAGKISFSESKFCESWPRAYAESFKAASHLITLAKGTIDRSLDRVARSGNIYAAHSLFKNEFAAFNTLQSFDGIYDFYNDPNVPETENILDIVRKFDKRLALLLERWPEHAVLSHLASICRKIVSFPLASPIMKLLSGLELLLQKSQDWEAYASKEVSLREELADVSSNIIRLRKLELSTWKDLFAVQRRKFTIEAGKLWLNLWQTLIMPFFDQQSVENDNYNQQLLAILDNFLLNSSLGEFPTRLNLISIFSSHLDIVIKNKSVPCLNLAKTAAVILKNIFNHYSMFSVAVESHVRGQEKSVIKELNEFIKIASWKDVNAFALKESAKKSHYQLHKFVKRFKLVLTTPLKQIIATSLESTSIDKSHDQSSQIKGLLEQAASVVFPQLQIPGVSEKLSLGSKWLPKLGSLMDKMSLLNKSIIAGSALARTTTCLDDMTTDILQQVNDFKESGSSLEAGSKSAKYEKSVRRKAFIDGIKQFSWIGLSRRCTQMYLVHQDPNFVFQQPVLSDSLLSRMSEAATHLNILFSETHNVITSSDLYYYRLLSRVGKVRESVHVNCGDINERESEICVSYLDHLLHMVMECRRGTSEFLECLGSLVLLVSQLDKIHQSSSQDQLPLALKGGNHAQVLVGLVDEIHKILSQTKLISMTFENVQATNGWSVTLNSLLSKISSYRMECASALEYGFHADCELIAPLPALDTYTQKTRHVLGDVNSTLLALDQTFFIQEALEAVNRVSTKMDSFSESLKRQSHTADQDASIDALVDGILICYQSFISDEEGAIVQEDIDLDVYGMKEGELVSASKLFEKLAQSKRIASVVSLFKKMLKRSLTDKNILEALIRVLPLLQQLAMASQRILLELAVYLKCICKMACVSATIVDTILKQGFCVPKGNGEDADEGQEQDASGMGIGEGEGKKDVSDEIENEGQVEGLQNEKPPEEQKNIQDEENGIEMEEDFEGSLEDIKGDDQDNDDTQSQGDQEQELEDQMGDLDDAGDVVDEKLWDENDDQVDRENEKTEMDAPVQGDTDNVETVAKTEEPDSGTPQEEKNKPSEKEEAQGGENEMQETEEQDDLDEESGVEGINEDTEDRLEENHNLDVRDQDTMDLDDDEAMDLPEDMGLDDDEMDLDAENGPDPENIEEQDAGPEEDFPEDADELPAPAELEAQDTEPQEPEAKEDIETHDKEESNLPVDDEDQRNNQSYGVQGDTAKESNTEIQGESAERKESMPQEDVPNADKKESPATSGEKQRSSDQNEPMDANQPNPEPNPRRSLGDALKTWMKRLQNVSDASPEKEEKEPQDSEHKDTGDKAAEYEFVEQDDNAFDAEALDVATQDQMNQMNQKAFADDERETEYQQNQQEDTKEDNDDEEEEMETLEKAERSHDFDKKNSNRPIGADQDIPPSLESIDIDDEQGNALKDERKEEDEEQGQEMRSRTPLDDDQDQSDFEMDVESYETLRHSLEKNLAKWREQGQDLKNARELWKDCVSLTQGLSFALCEQLRLILEPTLAAKLKGDYRTGKRLNMRKIIPYIASQFKKDKIWLRRTKPSKRTYQIMIAIDDSKSMAESKSVQLAYESLALITKALSQLEAGDLSVISFGETVDLLHPFNRAFSDEAGANIIQKFTFDQDRTHIKNMMNQSIRILDEARAFAEGGASTTELWQLQLIISDGICEDHAQIRAIVRKAAESRIMVVFLVLDTQKSRSSISTMTNVTYGTDPNTQKPILQMNRYMDTFPFDYFVLVKDINSLPEVLSETLRQYFMFTSVS